MEFVNATSRSTLELVKLGRVPFYLLLVSSGSNKDGTGIDSCMEVPLINHLIPSQTHHVNNTHQTTCTTHQWR